MVSAGSYLLSAVLLAVLALSVGFSVIRIRRRLMPSWEGAPSHLAEAILAISLLIWLSELLGILQLLYAGTLVAASLLLAGAIALTGWGRGVGLPGPGAASSFSTRPLGASHDAQDEEASARTGQPHASAALTLIAIGVIAVVFAHWGLTTKDALDRGIFNFDSLWYHMPFAAEIAQSHSVTGLHYTETVFTNWFYPQNSELLHSVGILLMQRDTLSLFLNFAWLALAFLAAWCVGRPYGRAQLSVVAAGIVLECHTLVVREPGAAKNDLMAAALLLAAIALLVNAWGPGEAGASSAPDEAGRGDSSDDEAHGSLPVGWPLATAGLAVGLAVGTKVTALAMAAALTVAVIALAPAGRRWAASAWWFLAALAGGAYWYLRNLVVVGNPLPQVEHLGPISLPHPERLQTGRPDFSVAHYATDTGVWRDYFAPGLHEQLGALWPLVLAGAIGGAVLALGWGHSRVLRWVGGVALFGMLAYVVTPLTAAGAEGAPTAFAINIRFAIPALLAGIVLLPLAPNLGRGRTRASARALHPPPPWGKTVPWLLPALLLGVLVLTDRADAVLRDPDRLFGLLVAVVAVLIPAALVFARQRGAPRSAVAAGFAILALAAVAIGYPVQRDYLRDRYRNDDPQTSIPGMHLDSAYRWARDVRDSRIGLVGTTAGFLQYGFYGTDLSNDVRYLGVKGPHGAFNAIPTCRGFRAAVNAADLDFLITAPFLNYIHPEEPVPSPEARWLRGEPAVTPILREGPVVVWRVRGRLDPADCRAENAPFREVPRQPKS
jgi:hypothetical protein